ncbi:Pheophytinase, chloroplastic [Glycine max]|nr:Pheophytinase, chloroplastic [Glycine max]
MPSMASRRRRALSLSRAMVETSLYKSMWSGNGEPSCALEVPSWSTNTTWWVAQRPGTAACEWQSASPSKSWTHRLGQRSPRRLSEPRYLSPIAEVLSQVYADHSTNVDNVFSRIVETTRHPAAAVSFASIMFAF